MGTGDLCQKQEIKSKLIYWILRTPAFFLHSNSRTLAKKQEIEKFFLLILERVCIHT